MDDLGDDDISDTQFNDIVEDWSQGDSFSQSNKPERKRKSSDSELPRYHKVRVIVANPQLNAENNTDSSIIFRPWEDRNQSMGNQFGAGRGEPEKNPQPENEELLEPDQNHQHEKDSHEVEPQAETAKEQGEETISFKDRLFTISYEPSNARDINKTGEKYKSKIKGKVKEYMDRNITFHLRYKVRLVKVDMEGEEERVVKHFNSGNRRLLDMEEFDEEYRGHMDKINDELENYTGEGSGWVLEQIESLFLQISRYKPIRGASYIPTPEGLKGKHAIINVQNVDDMLCFIYSILAFLYPVSHKDHPYRPNKYKQDQRSQKVAHKRDNSVNM